MLDIIRAARAGIIGDRSVWCPYRKAKKPLSVRRLFRSQQAKYPALGSFEEFKRSVLNRLVRIACKPLRGILFAFAQRVNLAAVLIHYSRYSLIGNLSQSQEVGPSSPHSIMS